MYTSIFHLFWGGRVLWEELCVTACWCKSHMLAHLNGLVLCFEEAVFKDFSCLQQFSLQCSFHLLPPGFPRSLRCALLKSLIAILPLVSPLRILRCTDSWSLQPRLSFIQTVFKSFSLFVRKSSNRQSPLFTSSAVWIINIVFLWFQKYPEFLMSSHRALPAFIGVVTITTVWKETHMGDLRRMTHCYADKSLGVPLQHCRWQSLPRKTNTQDFCNLVHPLPRGRCLL